MLIVPPPLRRRAAEIEGWLELERPDKALAKSASLLADPTGRSIGLYFRVRALVALGRLAEALHDLDELRPFEADPEWLDLTEAWCLKRTGRIDSAAGCMRRLVERSRRSAIGWFNLGCYLALLGRSEEAIDSVTMACGLEPELRKSLTTEPDLESLRTDARFVALSS